MLRFFLTYRGVRIESKQDGKYVPAEKWRDIEQIIKRSELYAGITYKISSELQFSGPFVNILDQIKANGFGEDAFIEIWKKNQITNEYESKFVGLIDLLGSTKQLTATGREYYTINTTPIGFERDFDNNFDVSVNVTDEKDLNENAILPFDRPFDYIGLKPLSIKKNLEVESVVVNDFDAGSDLRFNDDRNYYFFMTAFHEQLTKQEFEEYFQNNPTLVYDDYSYEGPDPLDPYDHETVLNAAPQSLTNNNEYVLKAEVDGDYSLTWQWDYDFKLDAVATNEVTERYQYWVLLVIINRDDPLNPVLTIEQIDTQEAQGIDLSLFEFSNSGFISRDYSLKAGEELYLIPYFTVHPKNNGVATDFSYNELLFTVNIDKVIIEGVTKFEQTNPSAYLIHELFSRLVNKITGEFNAFNSPFYGRTDSQPIAYSEDGEGALTAIMDGRHLRGWPIGNDDGESSLNLSFKELFESEKAKHNIDLGIVDNKVIIDKFESFFDSENASVDLGCIRDLEISTDSKLFYNEIEAGYSDWKNSENKDGAGLQEFNTLKNQTTQFSGINAKYLVTSKFIAGGYPIETTRQEQKYLDAEKETQNDNKIFMIALQRTDTDIGDGTEEDPAFENETYKSGDPTNPWLAVSGVDFPEEVYNIRWQPGRMVRNHGNKLRLSVEQSENDAILTQSMDGNKLFSSQLKTEANPVKEADNILGTELGDSLFTGNKFSFETSLSDDQIAAMLANPYYHIKFSDAKGNEYKAVLPMGEELPINIVSNSTTFNLLEIQSPEEVVVEVPVDGAYEFHGNEKVTIPDIPEYERTSAFVFKCRVKNTVWPGVGYDVSRTLFSNQTEADAYKGLEFRAYGEGNVWGNRVFIMLNNNAVNNRLTVLTDEILSTSELRDIEITYDGSGLASGFTAKVNDVAVNVTGINSTLSADIGNGDGFVIGDSKSGQPDNGGFLLDSLSWNMGGITYFRTNCDNNELVCKDLSGQGNDGIIDLGVTDPENFFKEI